MVVLWPLLSAAWPSEDVTFIAVLCSGGKSNNMSMGVEQTEKVAFDGDCGDW